MISVYFLLCITHSAVLCCEKGILSLQWLNYSARNGGYRHEACRAEARAQRATSRGGFPTVDQRFSSIQRTLFGFYGI